MTKKEFLEKLKEIGVGEIIIGTGENSESFEIHMNEENGFMNFVISNDDLAKAGI